MTTGAITGYIDVAQLVLYAFWIFFAGLVIYLRREDKRDGYPLVGERSRRAPRVKIQGFPAMPAPKNYLLADGSVVQLPRGETPNFDPIPAKLVDGYSGSPYEPTGNPMIDGVGPATYANRKDIPDMTFEGETLLAPLRVAKEFGIVKQDPDPRGMPVVAADGKVAGTVRDCWIDRAEPQIRYLEVEVPTAGGSRNVLLPYGFAKYDVGRRLVKVASITAAQFADVPGLRNPDVVTRLEEERISAYYGGGTLYATPDRFGPVL
jgi:photosynthetic reaction center H subunit